MNVDYVMRLGEDKTIIYIDYEDKIMSKINEHQVVLDWMNP